MVVSNVEKSHELFNKACHKEKHALLLPIRLTLIYLIVSILVYAFGPFNWNPSRPFVFYGLLIIYTFSLYVGYKAGISKYKGIDFNVEISQKKLALFSIVFTILIICNYFLYIINIFRDYGFSNLDFIGLYNEMRIGLRNPGLGYNLRYERFLTLQGVDVIGGSAISFINYVWSVVRYPIILASMLYFKKLNIISKTVTIMYLVTMFLFYLSIGTTIDVFHIFLFLELAPILNAFTKWAKGTITKRDVVKLITAIIIGFMIIGSYFMWMMLSRGGINSYDDPNYNVGGVELNINDENDSDFGKGDTNIPPIVMKFWVSFSGYFSQGYHAMAQGLELDWTPMFGLGSNMFVVDFTSEHIYDIQQFTYQEKLEKEFGWEAGIRWHSMYTWLANDVSFYGVPFVMALIGFIFAAMFKDAIIYSNPFAKLSIFYFMLMMFFIPCNNQIGQRADTLVSFVILILFWLGSIYLHKKKNKGIARND